MYPTVAFDFCLESLEFLLAALQIHLTSFDKGIFRRLSQLIKSVCLYLSLSLSLSHERSALCSQLFVLSLSNEEPRTRQY